MAVSRALVRKLEDQVKTLKSKGRDATAAKTKARIPTAVGLSAAMLGGAFSAGMTDAMSDGEVFGVSIDIAGALLCIGAGIAAKQPYLIAFGAGLVADGAREKGFEVAQNFMVKRVDTNQQHNTTQPANSGVAGAR